MCALNWLNANLPFSNFVKWLGIKLFNNKGSNTIIQETFPSLADSSINFGVNLICAKMLQEDKIKSKKIVKNRMQTILISYELFQR